MIKIITRKRSGKNIKEFGDRAWAVANKEHFGQPLDWSKETLRLLAKEDGQICGLAKIYIFKVGICRVDELIVDKSHRRQGIGRQLMNEVEKIARQKKCHSINLLTGKNWPEVKFYQALNYKIIAEIPKYYANIDWVEMVKYIK